jgi:hypothetical protein
VRFTLGEAEEKSGKLASAKASYTLALKEARATGDEQAAGAAGVALAAIERRVPRLVLRLTGRVAGARASVDGQEVKLTERGVELDPGEHRVQVRAPGRKPFERGVSVSEGRTVELAVRLEPERAAGPVATGGRGPQTAELGGPAGAWGPPAGAWVLGATGLAATVVGGVLYATGQGAYDEAAGACAAGGCAEPKHADDANAARRQMVAGDVLMVVGLGAIAGGGLWWAVSAGSGAEPPAPARHGVGVVASSGGFAVTFGGKL